MQQPWRLFLWASCNPSFARLNPRDISPSFPLVFFGAYSCASQSLGTHLCSSSVSTCCGPSGGWMVRHCPKLSCLFLFLGFLLLWVLRQLDSSYKVNLRKRKNPLIMS